MRCPYCIEGGNFKAMMGQGGLETAYVCARCGHLAQPTDPSFKCMCNQCVASKHERESRRF